jgi:AcrR family transcriptional regulator
MSQPVEQAPTKRRERRDARENRRHLLAVAKQLFAAQGIEATSMHEIARAAEVGQGTLYRHFADKGELCHALIVADLAAFEERVGALISPVQGGPALQRLAILIEEKNRLTESHLPYFAAIDAASANLRPGKPFRGPFHAWLHQQIVGLLSEAASSGQVAPLDAEFTAEALLAAVAPHVYRYQRQELGFSQARIDAAMRRLFVDGLRAPQ